MANWRGACAGGVSEDHRPPARRSRQPRASRLAPAASPAALAERWALPSAAALAEACVSPERCSCASGPAASLPSALACANVFGGGRGSLAGGAVTESRRRSSAFVAEAAPAAGSPPFGQARSFAAASTTGAVISASSWREVHGATGLVLERTLGTTAGDVDGREDESSAVPCHMTPAGARPARFRRPVVMMRCSSRSEAFVDGYCSRRFMAPMARMRRPLSRDWWSSRACFASS